MCPINLYNLYIRPYKSSPSYNLPIYLPTTIPNPLLSMSISKCPPLLLGVCIALLLSLAPVSSFSPSAFVLQRPHALPPLRALITESEASAVLKKANICLEEECSLEAVNDLLVEMRGQQEILKSRLEEITSLVRVLTEMNLLEDDDSSITTPTRDVDEIKASVKSLARVFTASAKSSGNDYPSLAFPSGWTGEKNKGKSTAYDRDMTK